MHNNNLVLVIGQETTLPIVDIIAVLSEINFGNIHTLGDNIYLCSLVSDEQKEENNISARGIIKHVSLLPTAQEARSQIIHASNTRIRLSAERLGNIDSVRDWEQAAVDSLALPDGFVEVEVFAAGMNYKDVVSSLSDLYIFPV